MNIIFHVPDMTCGHCEKAVRGAVEEVLPGAVVAVDLQSRRVTVTASGNPELGSSDAGLAGPAGATAAEDAIREAGYSPQRLAG